MATKTLRVSFASEQVAANRLFVTLQSLDRLYYWILALRADPYKVDLSMILDLLLPTHFEIPFGVPDDNQLRVRSLRFGSDLVMVLEVSGKDGGDSLDKLEDAVKKFLEEVKANKENTQEAAEKAVAKQIEKVNALPINNASKQNARATIIRLFVTLLYGLSNASVKMQRE